jgi:pyrrolidone-carboxylate peptidase
MAIPEVDKVHLSSSEKSIRTFVNNLDLEPYERVLGLGMYGGPDKESLRVEMVAINRFRNQGAGDERIVLPGFLKESPGLKTTNAMGSSYCNLVSYLLAKRLESEAGQVQFNFVHVPKSFSEAEAVQILAEQL